MYFLYILGDGTHPDFGHHLSEVPPPDELKKQS